MLLFMHIMGLLIFLTAVFMLGFYIRIIVKGECVTGEVCGISNGHGSSGVHSCSIQVQFKKEKQYIKCSSLNHFDLIHFFVEFQLSRTDGAGLCVGRRIPD